MNSLFPHLMIYIFIFSDLVLHFKSSIQKHLFPLLHITAFVTWSLYAFLEWVKRIYVIICDVGYTWNKIYVTMTCIVAICEIPVIEMLQEWSWILSKVMLRFPTDKECCFHELFFFVINACHCWVYHWRISFILSVTGSWN